MARRTICLDCRTRIEDGQRCDLSPEHRVVPLDGAALVDEVWGAPERRSGRRPARNDHILAASLALAPLVVGAGFLLLAVKAGPQLDWVFMAGLFPLSLILAVPALGRGMRRMVEMHSLVPRAVPIASCPAGQPGRVVTGELHVSPSRTACVASAVRLRFRRRVLLQDGVTDGFTIRLDDGREVRVPAGRIRLHAPPARTRSVAGWTITSDLPGAAETDELPRFPYDGADEIVLKPGDRIELCSPITALPDPHARPTLYREPAATCLVADGVPTVMLVL